MKASFDGARINLARSFNEVVRVVEGNDDGGLNPGAMRELREALWDLRANVGGMLCLYDPDCEDDINMLADKITLLEPDEVE
jgi:hypothetical protein